MVMKLINISKHSNQNLFFTVHERIHFVTKKLSDFFIIPAMHVQNIKK